MTPAPVRKEPDAAKWPHGELLRRVRAALLALPAHVRAETNIEGVAAPDLFTLNTMLGATIEDQVVAALNRMRQAWDPDGEYAHAGFVRQAQTFPDVRLEAGAGPADYGDRIEGLVSALQGERAQFSLPRHPRRLRRPGPSGGGAVGFKKCAVGRSDSVSPVCGIRPPTPPKSETTIGKTSAKREATAGLFGRRASGRIRRKPTA